MKASAPTYDLNRNLGMQPVPERPWPRKQKSSPFAAALGYRGIKSDRAYDAASGDRMNEHWSESWGSADSDLLDVLPVLRERSRASNRNNPIAAAITRAYVDNVIGTGIVPQARIDAEALGLTREEADAWNRQVDASFMEWAKTADLTGQQSFWALQKLFVRKWVEDGDVFGLPVLARSEFRKSPVMIEAIEAERCDSPNFGLDERIRGGVERSSGGEIIAYWFLPSHPGNLWGSPKVQTPVRVPAWTREGRRRVMHLWQMLRPEQSRGVPFFTPVLDRLGKLESYSEAERIAALVQSCFTGWIKRTEPIYNALLQAGNPNVTTTSEGRIVEQLEPGIIEHLAPGEDIVFGNPSRPSTNYEPFVLISMREIGAPLGLPLELILCDWTKTTWTSGRMSLIEAWRTFGGMQAHMIESGLRPVRELWLEEEIRAGRIKAPQFRALPEAYFRCRWVAQGRTWVDPLKEVAAAEAKIKAGLSTFAEECAALGKDPDEVLEQLVRERAQRRAKGIGLDLEDFGASVRAGVLTPQLDDERYVREAMALPPAGPDVEAAWKEEGGARRPITLTQPSEPVPPAVEEQPAPERETREEREEREETER